MVHYNWFGGRSTISVVIEMGWEVKNKNRPEDKTNAEEYFEKYGEDYAKSNAIRNIQHKITLRAIELAQWPKGARILDLGCGSGFSMEVLDSKGYKSVGIDISDKMLQFAKESGFDVRKADARELPFEDESFDGILSISMLQWLGKKDVEKVALECYRVLKQGGTGIIQFYPRSEDEMIRVGRAFVKAGFTGEFAIDNPKNARKRKIYLIVRKATKKESEGDKS